MPPSFIVAPLDRTQAAKAHVRCGVSRIKLNGLQERLNGRLSLTLQVVQGTEGTVRLWVSGIVLQDFVLLGEGGSQIAVKSRLYHLFSPEAHF